MGSPGPSERIMPPTAAVTAISTDVTTIFVGLALMHAAAETGVIRSERTNRAPTICTAMAAVSPSKTMNTIDRKRNGRPRAEATSGSTEEN